MAIYRKLPVTFWNEPQLDNYTAEDKYFYCYLHSNKMSNLCGCFVFSVKEAAHDMCLDMAKIETLLERAAEIHKAIMQDKETNEILVCDWKQRNWSTSSTTAVGIVKELREIKSEALQAIMDKITLDYITNEVIPNCKNAEQLNPVNRAKDEINNRMKPDTP